MKVSIIIPIYNSEKYLNKCLDSVVKQSYKNIEVLLINDGSKDNSESICLDFQKNDNRVKYFYKQNSGVSDTRNFGIKESTGEKIFFLDSDDYLDVDLIEKLIKNEIEGRLVSSLMNQVFAGHNKVKEYSKNSFEKEEYIIKMLNGSVGGFSCGYLLDSKIVKKILYDNSTNYLEDMMFMIKYLKLSSDNEIYFINNSYYNYLYNENSTTNSKDYRNKIENVFNSLNKIDKITEYKYSDSINLKKVRMLENLMRNIESINSIKTIREKYIIEKYKRNNIRYRIFSYIYIKKMYRTLYFYFKVRNFSKKILKKV